MPECSVMASIVNIDVKIAVFRRKPHPHLALVSVRIRQCQRVCALVDLRSAQYCIDSSQYSSFLCSTLVFYRAIISMHGKVSNALL
jgi:hypothetical protein